jgi:hypothetical protein
MADGTRMQQRRATEAVWATSGYVLANGELGVTTDTGIIKIGNGVSAWSDLDPAFDSQYLPILGKAADSDLLDGISSGGFWQTADATTAATASKLALRTGTGTIKAAVAAASDDVVNFDQWDNGRKELVSRTLSDATSTITLATTDIHAMVKAANSSLTQQRLIIIPTNSSAAIPVGSWIDICSTDQGNLKLSPAGGVTLDGKPHIFGQFSTIRILKTATDTWVSIPLNSRRGHVPKIRVTLATLTAWPTSTETAVPFDTIDSTKTFNPDNEWFSIPSPNLATARRVAVAYTGEYLITVNWNGSTGTQGISRIAFMTANNVIGQRIASSPTLFIGSVVARIRLTAGDTIGAIHLNSAAQNAQVDGTDPHDMTIMLIGD